MQDGQVYPIEILISEIPGGSFNMMLFVEQLDASGHFSESNPEPYTLFRTTLDLPEQPNGSRNGKLPSPSFNPYGPIWRVVRSSASSGGGSGSLIGGRTAPRTATVNEDDDDLSL